MEWHPFYYKGEETNIEVNEIGQIRKIKKDWLKPNQQINTKTLIDKQGYPIISFRCKNIKATKLYRVHQIMAIVFLNHKPCGFKYVIDHIDKNKQNNNVENLRIVSQRENSFNRKKSSKYGTGVAKENNRYKSYIQCNKVRVYLGMYKTAEEASLAYQKALSDISMGLVVKNK
jgi:hypothetical protein